MAVESHSFNSAIAELMKLSNFLSASFLQPHEKQTLIIKV